MREVSGHPKEIDVERLVLNSPLLDEASRADIRMHLAGCASCRGLRDAFTTLYDAWQRSESDLEHSHPREPGSEASSLPPLVSPVPILLHPVAMRQESADIASLTIALAAQDASERPAFTILRTALSNDARTMLRVVRDHGRDRCFGQILTDDDVAGRRMLIIFAGCATYFATDSTGCFDIPPHLVDAVLAGSPCIHMPEAVFHITPHARASVTTGSIRVTDDDSGSALALCHDASSDMLSAIVLAVPTSGWMSVLLPRGSNEILLPEKDGTFHMSMRAGDLTLELFHLPMAPPHA